MFERWQLQDFDPGTIAAWQPDAGVPQGAWLDVEVPGDTYTALLVAGRIQHPFRGRHESDAAWVGAREWWWHTGFAAAPQQAGERIELVFEGLDTFARVYLNGRLLGATDNMFRTWRFEVGGQLRAEGDNELLVVFSTPAQQVAGRDFPNWGPLSVNLNANQRNLMRKAQFGWGWDWGPNLPTVGVWKPVRLERVASARLTDVRAATVELSDAGARLEVNVAAEAVGARAALQARLQLLGPDGERIAAETLAISSAASTTWLVQQPRLWWTADLGEQPLYTLVADLLCDGTVVDTQTLKIGLRTLTLDQSADPEEPGTNFFRFVLNGVPIFARGACWIPASSFVGALTEADYRPLLDRAVQANMNMLRVWGGGIYEHDAFYDLCDRLGLLVWQDFMFACAPYPEKDAAFVDNVRHEIRDQVRRLRHHPSLALWCGNNECQVIHAVFKTMTGSTAMLEGTALYEKLMPELVAELDPATPYWPGSPWGGPHPNSMRAGDVHNWTVWHGFPLVPDDRLVGELDRSPAGVDYRRYAEDRSRFVSEFGIQSAPPLSSLRRWMEPGDLELGSAGFLQRIKDEPKDKVNGMLVSSTGLPSTLEQYVDFTMLLQAEGLKFGIEHFRRRKPHCSGTLIWQLNDCWPCVSWSLIDYDAVAKASFHAVARAYAPVLASFRTGDDEVVELWISNDTLRPITGEAMVQLSRFTGDVDWSVPVSFAVAANASAMIWRQPGLQAAPDRVMTVSDAASQFPANRLLFAALKDLPLAAGAMPKVECARRDAGVLEVRLTADTYLLGVGLESPRASTRFSDNSFDLRAGETRTIQVTDSEAVLAPEDLTIRCWNQHRPALSA